MPSDRVAETKEVMADPLLADCDWLVGKYGRLRVQLIQGDVVVLAFYNSNGRLGKPGPVDRSQIDAALADGSMRPYEAGPDLDAE